MTELVQVNVGDGVTTLALNNGKANVLSHDVFDALDAAFDAAEEAGHLVILTGQPGMFSGGFDLKEMYKGPEPAKILTSRGSKLARRILAFPTPVIGVSSGHCIAMGAFLMLACDYRIGVDGPFKIGLNETAIGMPMHSFGIELGRYRLTNQYFNRCVINAEIFDPEGAVAAGFYDRTVPADHLSMAGAKAAEMMGQLKMHAFKATKRNSRKALFALLDECIENDLNMTMATLGVD